MAFPSSSQEYWNQVNEAPYIEYARLEDEKKRLEHMLHQGKYIH